jgi:hypothetical protein
VTGAELHHKDGEWFLHLRTKAEVESDTLEQATTGHSTVLGVHKSEALVQPIRNRRFLRTSTSA